MFKRCRFTTLATFVIAGAVAAIAVGEVANAATVFDTTLASPGFYSGSGNPQNGFTVTTEGNTEIALGVINRNVGVVHPTSGSVYDVSTGLFSGSGFCNNNCALWNIQFSLNLGAGSGTHLSDITTLLTVKNLTTLAASSFNPLSTFLDNDGWNGSKNGANANLSTDYGFQNSENLKFGEFSALNFNPLENTSYLVTFTVSQGESQLASVQETINATPIPAALPLFATGLGVMGFFARRKKRKQTAAIAAA